MKTVFYVALLSCQVALANPDWICGEAASVKKNDTVLACGIGYGANEGEARESAFEAAKREFANVCSDSVDCKGKDFVITPMRSTCERDGSSFRCYRGVQYKIVEKNLQNSEVNFRQVKNIDKEEIDWRFRLGVGYSGTSASDLNTASGFVCCGSFDVELQRRVLWRFHIAARYSHRAGFTGTGVQSGTPNSSTNFDTSVSENEFALSLPFELTSHWFVSPEYGAVSSGVTSTARTYNALGQGTDKGTSTRSSNNSFVGGQIRYESDMFNLSKTNLGFYFSGGYRQYPNNGAANASVGIQFGF